MPGHTPFPIGGLSADRLRQFSSALGELHDGRDVDETLQLMVDLATDVLRGVDFADVMFVRKGQVSTPVASDQVAAELDRAQHETGEGPCLVVLREQHSVVADDLDEDDRWPAFTPRALELGVRSVAAYRLFYARGELDDQYGALNLFGTDPGFDDHDLELGEVFAASCSEALSRAIDREGVEVALLAREVIGQAKGILMVSHGLTAPEAYEMLQRAAAEHDSTVGAMASEIVAGTATLA